MLSTPDSLRHAQRQHSRNHGSRSGGQNSPPSSQHHGNIGPVWLPEVAPDPARVAVLLNRNARQVNDRLLRAIERLVGPEHVYYSRSIEEAEGFCREIVQRGYGTVVSGGGDGTLVRTINLVQRYIDESNAWRQERFRRFGELQHRLMMPRFAFLRLGTGNGLSRVVGASNPYNDIRYLIEEKPTATVQLPLIDCGTERFFFGGMGYDSQLLADYNWLCDKAGQGPMRHLTKSLAGYFAALFMRTLPRALMHGADLQIRVTSKEEASYVDPRRGDMCCPLPANSVLYEGPVSMLGVGTTPFFGYGMRVFPFAGHLPGTMHLRLTTLSALGSMVRLPAIWNGTMRHPTKMHDFLVREVSIELNKPFPFQHSGDDHGAVSQLNLKIADSPLSLVDLYGSRCP